MGLPARKIEVPELWTPPERKLRLYTPDDLRRCRADHFPAVVPYRPLLNAITYKQGAVGSAGNAATSVSATWPGATTAGSNLFAIMGIGNSLTGALTSLPSGWTEQASSPWTNSINCTLRFFTALGAASQSGAQTFTETATFGTGGVCLIIAEYAGVSSTLDTTSAGTNPTAVATGTASGITSNAFTPTNGLTDLTLFFCVTQTGSGGTGAAVTFSYTGGGTLRPTASENKTVAPKFSLGIALEDSFSNSGSITTTVTSNIAGNWIAISAAYQIAAAAGGFFRAANLTTGAGGPFFVNPVG
jgi:hypothetical protein